MPGKLAENDSGSTLRQLQLSLILRKGFGWRSTGKQEDKTNHVKRMAIYITQKLSVDQ
jgi:hypothetical protein